MNRLVVGNVVGDARLVGDRLIGECADAVLRLTDGDLVECSKFVMMASCPVLRAMLELRSEVRDGKYVIPVSDTGRRKYDIFCDLIHHVVDVLTVGFEDLLGAYDCARRFGCEEIGRALLARAWDVAPSPKTTSMAEFVPHMFELGPGVVAHVIETAAIELPLWTDLERTFLAPLAPLTGGIARDLTLLQHHYPPAAVSKWVLRHLPDAAIDENLAFDLVTINSHLYGGDETRAVYGELIKLYDVHPDWDRRISKFATGVLASTAWNHRTEPGSYVEYENLPRMTVYATFDPPRRTKKFVLLAPHVRIRTAPFGFDVRADLLGHTTFQVRVTASKRLSMLDPFYEAWYAFQGAAATGWTSAAEPVMRHGDVTAWPMTGPFFVRLDIRHATTNAMLRPFDASVIASMIT